MASQLITIIGITGNQGSSVAETFLKIPGWKVRGITRDPSQPSAQEWAKKGVQVVSADLKNSSSLIGAFEGSDVIFAMTHFAAALHDPEAQDKISKGLGTFAELGKELELQCGKNIVDAAAAVMTRHPLKRFIFSTLSGATHWSKGKFSNICHFESKYEVVQYMQSSQPRLAAVASTLQLGYFHSNWQMGERAIPLVKKQSDSTYLVRSSLSPDVAVPHVDPQSDTGPLVEALVMSCPPDTHVLGYGSMMSMKQWTDLFAKTQGVTARYEKAPRAEAVDKMHDGWGDELVSMLEYTEEFGLHGGDPAVKSPAEIGVKAPLKTLEEFMKKEDFSSVLD